MTPPRDPRDDLKLPLAIAGLLLGGALFAVMILDAPRAALAVLVLALVIVLAILRELIFTGDR